MLTTTEFGLRQSRYRVGLAKSIDPRRVDFVVTM